MLATVTGKAEPRVRLLVITGATATGKTSLGVDLAHQIGSEIISADSRQVYRGLDIGTGKDLEEYSRVSPPVLYHLIDIVDPDFVYTLYHFQRDCYELLDRMRVEEPFAGGTPLVMVGGTPLYIASVLLGYQIHQVPENPELRLRLEQQPLGDLVEELNHHDPELAARTDISTKRRVIRALEIVEQSRLGQVKCTGPPPFVIESKVFAIRTDRKQLHQRIDSRLEVRLEHGLVDEVRELLDRGVSRQRMTELGLEYREVSAYLLGEISYETMVEQLKHAIHRFARRQEIWFRSFDRRGIPVTWIAADDLQALLEWV
jgi:tRNA dimethylallyltransferase